MGGMAEVYRAKASGAGGFEKQLAIKRILPNYSQNEEFRRMFEYEARLSSMLTHSNIVQIYDFVKSSDTYLLAMEYVDGKNLRQFINKMKKIGFALPIEFGVYIVAEVCKGLEYAHKKRDDLTNRPLNIIHRDMSPQNVMLSYEGSVKIVDFGIAKAKDRVDETRSGVIKGKFGYMSPEQANGESVDHRTDIFSTTIILYELLTSKRLFAAENDMATLKLIQECLISPPSRINPKVPPELEKIVMKGLTKDLGLRYQSAGDMHRHLQEFLNKHYGSFTQKDLADAMLRVFKEEITSEKKRFEQIYRQSIPFSQGAKLDDNHGEDDSDSSDERSEASNQSSRSRDEEDITRSEAVEKTGETNFEENSDVMPSEIPFDVGSEGLSAADPSRSKVSLNNDPLSEEKSIGGIQGETKNEYVIPEFSDETMPATRAQGKVAQNQPATATEPLEQNEKTVVENSISMFTDAGEPSVGTPTEGATESRKEELRGQARFPKTSLPASGVSLENSGTNVAPGRRERSISRLSEVSSKDSELPSSFTDNSDGHLTLSESTPVVSRRNEPEFDTSTAFPPERDDSTSSVVTVLRGLLTALVLVAILIGTFKVWRVYLAGGLPSFMDGMISKYSSTKGDKKQPIADDSQKTPDPVRHVANECTINIDSDPRGATVTINNQTKGSTPTTLGLPCGRDFNVTMIHEGFESASENVVMNAQNKKLYETLKKIPMGNLELTVNPGVNIEVPDANFSEYARGGEIVSIPLRANVRHKVHLKNEVLGIDVTREYKVTEGAVTRETLSLNPDDKHR